MTLLQLLQNEGQMPSSTPTINVNLTPCACFGNYANLGATQATARPIHHDRPCRDGSPVLIPCPIPRSVPFEVVMGMCNCFGPSFNRSGQNAQACSARPIRVSCSISGKTWEESEVVDLEMVEPDDGQRDFFATVELARARWALVKALALGHTDLSAVMTGPKAVELLAHRDAVFAAICELARTETAILAAQEHVVSLLDPKRVTFRPTTENARPSADALGVYVASLIAQVGELP